MTGVDESLRALVYRMDSLKRYYTFYLGGTHVNFYNGFCGGHHHLNGDAGIVTLVRKLFGNGMVREQLLDFVFFTGRHNKFEHV